MPTYVILAQTSTTAEALRAWLDLLGEGNRCEKRLIMFDVDENRREGGAVAYRSLVTRIEEAAQSHAGVLNLNDVVVLVDSIEPSEMSAVAEGASWSHLIAMLILTFPEVRWVFGCIAESKESFPREEHGLESLTRHPRREPLLDPTGLRDWVRRRTTDVLKNNKNTDHVLPARAEAAAAIDEERRYAYFHAYTAYRFGFRADVVTSWTLMKWLFGGTTAQFRAHWTTQTEEPKVELSASSVMNPTFCAPRELGPSDLEFRVHLRGARRYHTGVFRVRVRPGDGDDGTPSVDADGLSQTVKPGETVTLAARHVVPHDFSPKLECRCLASHGFYLLLEDMYLKFPDIPLETHLSWLRPDVPTHSPPDTEPGRAAHCPLLENTRECSKYRILVTTGHTVKDKYVVDENIDYLNEKPGGGGRVVYKPVGGLFEFWSNTGLTGELPGERRHGNAPGFVWPPILPKKDDAGEADPMDAGDAEPGSELQRMQREGGKEHGRGGHGAPGKLTLIAETVLRRAETLRMSAVTCEDCVRGAVLAMEACEYVGGRTPTLAFSALGLKHEYEVRAECAFAGTGHNFDVKQRINEINSEVASVTWWSSSEEQDKCGWDANARIINCLAVLFRSSGHFDEEHDCMVAVRKYHRKLARPKEWRWLFGLLPHVILVYAEWLLGSFGRFAFAVLGWATVFSLAWLQLAPVPPVKSGFWDRAISALGGSLNAFIGGNTGGDSNNALCVLSCAAATLGVFHLGVFISYVYSLISRR